MNANSAFRVSAFSSVLIIIKNFWKAEGVTWRKNWFFSFQEALKLVPGLLLFSFSIYFAWKKIGVGISYTYTIGISVGLGVRFKSFTLINDKDKVVAITRIVVVYEGVEIEIRYFKDPLLLKAYESIRIEPEPYSFVSLHGKPWELPMAATPTMELYVEVRGDNFPCRSLMKRRLLPKRSIRSRDQAQKFIYEYNEKIYCPSKVLYFVDYENEGEHKTSFILKGGAIVEHDGLNCNFIAKRNLISIDAAQAFLRTRNSTACVSLPT